MTTPPRTPQPLTADQLAEIQARAEAATSGPWDFYDGDTYADVAADLKMTGRGSYSFREKVARLEDENYWDDQAHEGDDDERAFEQMAANAVFIAHARTDVPALLAEVDRLKGQRKYLIEQLAKRDAETGRADRAVREFLGAEAVEPNVIAQALAQIRQVQPLDTYSANRLDLAARILTGEEAAS